MRTKEIMENNIGEVKSFLVNKEYISKDYLICNGEKYLKKDYPLLYEVAKITKGFSFSEEYFHVPNLNGCFLRYEEKDVDGNSRCVGEIQRHSSEPVKGWASQVLVYSMESEADGALNYSAEHDDDDSFKIVTGYVDGITECVHTKNVVRKNINIDSSNTLLPSNENRPKNVNVYYAIKAR